MKAERFPTPWWVYADRLRPQFPLRIVEIRAANDQLVIPWAGFDDCALGTYRQRVALARRIVAAVNKAAKKGSRGK
jgi:hypothetical protein